MDFPEALHNDPQGRSIWKSQLNYFLLAHSRNQKLKSNRNQTEATNFLKLSKNRWQVTSGCLQRQVAAHMFISESQRALNQASGQHQYFLSSCYKLQEVLRK